uniref:Uncharacterized protein n=1 Tax=Trichogramma kaykai TaxID=54128 RepID=A0ABD2WZQ0_9HYME
MLKTGSSSNDGGRGTADPFLTALAVHARPALYIPLHLSLIFAFIILLHKLFYFFCMYVFLHFFCMKASRILIFEAL